MSRPRLECIIETQFKNGEVVEYILEVTAEDIQIDSQESPRIYTIEGSITTCYGAAIVGHGLTRESDTIQHEDYMTLIIPIDKYELIRHYPAAEEKDATSQEDTDS